MNGKNLWLCAVLMGMSAAGVAIMSAAPQPPGGDLVVHEWGTFLAMQGSDGVTLDGMYHEEHALPAFVHARSRDQLHLPSAVLKGETPVIYFYTRQRQKVRVDVRFPHGIWTQWYPQAQVVAPALSQPSLPLQPGGGRIVWCGEVVPRTAGHAGPTLAQAAQGALWNYARDVDAAYVSTSDRSAAAERREYEQFLFYRGLGQLLLPLELSASGGGTLEAAAGGTARSVVRALRHLFILRVEGGKGAYRYLPEIAPGERVTAVIPSMAEAQPLESCVDRIAGELAARLTECGLYPKEARAMVNTWRESYFKTDGIRVLFVLPREWTDAAIPMQIQPRPQALVRVMVGRVELLTAERERRAEAAVRELGSTDAATRERAFNWLREQGRYVEPILRRVLGSGGDAGVRRLCRRLLTTGFVTDLRSALQSPTDGMRVAEDPVYVRAQLAGVLRELGLDAEAKAEGETVFAELEKRKAPPLNQPESRGYLRAYARVMEALGNEEGAAEWYGKLVRFGSQAIQDTRCRSCHGGNGGPTNAAWFRDWWAGKKLAAYLMRLGRRQQAIAAEKSALARSPRDAAAQLTLAYLDREAGERAKAAGMWRRLEAQMNAGG